MNLIKTIFASVLISTTLFSCDEIEELASFTTNASFEKSIPVAIAEDPENVTQSFFQSTTINIAEDEDIQENLSAIENITITSLTYELKNATGNKLSLLKNTSIKFGSTTIALSELNIIETDANNLVFQISDAAKLSAIGAALQSNPTLNITIEGTVENNPIDFDVSVTIGLAAEIQPI